ncbi:hypothetical protein ACCAA_1170018 [Candidatus Accumulibacter aalborgensis]|uniref:Uncharacterized protein n=1 Tax=Candidatus Accumulibacter aalborgensis TaxID=1860102 RepID=A0A1A8XIV0_9PROT|nr:hypothetical protein ACCAA_1170018 [Candidatus Accumulibacter aalborgensis]
MNVVNAPLPLVMGTLVSLAIATLDQVRGRSDPIASNSGTYNLTYNEILGKKKALKLQGLDSCPGGEGGIRTLGRLTPTPDFESGTFGHSATSPQARDVNTS